MRSQRWSQQTRQHTQRGLAGITESTIDDVLRRVREALSNALRQAAETISVAISASGDAVGIEVGVDGQGFDLAVEDPGLGPTVEYGHEPTVPGARCASPRTG